MNRTNNKFLLVIAIFFFSCANSSGVWMPLSVQIEVAEIIFEGVVVDVYSKREPKIKSQASKYKDGEVIKTWDLPPGIYTTFVFEIKDILKGEYLDNQIKVKMPGGCDEDTNDCVSLSTGYGYKVNDKAVLFVSLNKKNNYYKRSDYSSAYTLKGSLGLLTRDGHITYLQELDKNREIIMKDVLTLEVLKNEIHELEKQQKLNKSKMYSLSSLNTNNF